MLRCLIVLMACSNFLAISSCHLKSKTSQLQNQIPSATRSFPSRLWASKSIAVCLVNPEEASSFVAPIKDAVIREFGRIGFSLAAGWTKCTQEQNEAFPEKPLIRIRFDSTAPPPFGGATAVGAIYGKLSDITLRADPSTHSNPYCQKNQTLCMQNWAVHEVGHSFGLEHSHQHPLARIGGTYVYKMPISVSNTDHAFRSVNYLGSYEPNSIMSYAVDPSSSNLLPIDIRSLKALYEQPTVLLKGPSAEANARSITFLDLSVNELPYAEGLIDYPIQRPTHYRFKVARAEDDCTLDQGYSPLTPLAKPIQLDLKPAFPRGTAIKVCVLGSNKEMSQSIDAYSNLFWVLDEDRAKSYDFNGIVHLEQCSGSLVRFEGSEPDDYAMALTNAHCLGFPTGKVLQDTETEILLHPLSKNGTSRYHEGEGALRADRIIYASLGVTDIALLRLDKRFRELPEYRFFTLAKQGGKVGQEVDLISGLYSEGFSCSIEHIAQSLIEGDASFVFPMRYSQACRLFPGTSGSPMLDRLSGNILGINATGNEWGEKCSAQNPCEVEADGTITYQRGYGYALQTAFVYDCLTQEGKLDTSLPSCKLPGAK